jgi:hypothetical protein
MRRMPPMVVTALVLSSPGYAQHAQQADRAWTTRQYPQARVDHGWTAQQEWGPTTIWVGRDRVRVQNQGSCGPDALNCNDSANGS